MRLIDEIVTQAAYLETGGGDVSNAVVEYVCLTYKALSKIVVEVEEEYGNPSDVNIIKALSMPYLLITGPASRQNIDYFFGKKILP